MKKIFILLLLGVTIISTAQESVLLRINYKKGNKYLIKMDMNNDMGSMGFMNMKTEMESNITDVKDTIFETVMSFKRVSMDMIQQGITMSYDSNKKESELDERGRVLKAQIEPMLKMFITSKIDIFGKVLETKVEPNLPSSSKFSEQSNSVVYPKKAVKVGDIWTAEKDKQGMKINFIYTVKSITKENVNVDLSGKISGVGIGKVSGNMKIDRSIGIPTVFNMNMDISTNGINIKTTIKMITTKI